jgi:hypothetical protein
MLDALRRRRGTGVQTRRLIMHRGQDANAPSQRRDYTALPT